MLSIVIVNYNATSLINDCITSAMQFNSYSNFEWIIVDNNYIAETHNYFKNKFPFVKYIDMGYNAGFARANNKGIKIATGEAVLLLNPDTIILDDALDKCYQKFMHSTDVACGVQLLNEDLTPQISGHFFMKGGINHLLAIPYWGRIIKYIATIFKVKKPHIENTNIDFEVDWISGAFLMVKKDAINKFNLLDEQFFLYAEEVEWCSRLNNIGKLKIYGAFNVIHLMGKVIKNSSNTELYDYQNLSDKKGFQLMISNHLRIKKQYGTFWLVFQYLNFLMSIPFIYCSYFIFIILGKKRKTYSLKNINGFAINTFKLIKYILFMIVNKNYFYKVL